MTRCDLHEAAVLADAAATRLADPTAVDGLAKDGLSQSLAKGAAGIALLHIERARAGLGDWATVHAWLSAATRTPVYAGPDAGLYVGAPAVAFAVHTAADTAAAADSAAAQSDRYQRALTALHASVVALTRDRLDRAYQRLTHAEPPAFTEFDLLYGLTGLGAYHLRFDPGGDTIRRVLAYLVRLTEPIRRHGERLPGWWTHLPPTSQPSADFAGGHGNFGMAHGIAGPLALLALATRHGVTVDGQLDALDRIGAWFDTWRQDGDAGSWWPQWITEDEWCSSRVHRPEPLRASWCYGTPGIARAQQLAAIATGDTRRQRIAERALASCLADPHQLGRVVDTGLCHGWAGLVQTARHAAADAATGELAACLPRLTDAFVQHARSGTSEEAGLLDGDAGTALALHTAARGDLPQSGWDTCLLIV